MVLLHVLLHVYVCVPFDQPRIWLAAPNTRRTHTNQSQHTQNKHQQGPDASRRARALFLAMERHPWKMTLLLRFMYLPIAFKVRRLSWLRACVCVCIRLPSVYIDLHLAHPTTHNSTPTHQQNYGLACLPCPFHVFALCTLAASLVRSAQTHGRFWWGKTRQAVSSRPPF